MSSARLIAESRSKISAIYEENSVDTAAVDKVVNWIKTNGPKIKQEIDKHVADLKGAAATAWQWAMNSLKSFFKGTTSHTPVTESGVVRQALKAVMAGVLKIAELVGLTALCASIGSNLSAIIAVAVAKLAGGSVVGSAASGLASFLAASQTGIHGFLTLLFGPFWGGILLVTLVIYTIFKNPKLILAIFGTAAAAVVAV